jgi:glycosyltransferase involved in cell wall biosynthesis
VKPFETLLVLDPVPELIHFYEARVPSFVKIITSPEKGLSHARNAGIKNSSGEIIVFIDDDAYADPYWLENIQRNYEDPNVMGVGGLITPHWETERPKWFPQEFFWIVGCSYKDLELKRAVRNPIGANMSFRRSAFEKAGSFRSDIGRYGKVLLAGEEAEFSLKLLNLVPESKIMYEPRAIVYHRVPEERLSLSYVIKRAYYEGISKGVIAKSIKIDKALSTEQGYLSHLLTKFIPSKLKTFYRWNSLSQIVLTLMLIASVFVGYLQARIMM